jgi:quercetin dioxygenase-like cupin family protein
MHRTFLSLALCAALGTALAHDDHHSKDRPKVKVLSQKDVAEKVNGKKARATTVEVTFEPGQASAPHRHPGPVFGYVLEGEYQWAINDEPARTLKVGDTFYEPTGCLHRVSKNPSKTGKTRVLAIVLHPEDVKELVIPNKK